MKKLTIAALISMFAFNVNAGVFDAVMTADWPSKPTKKYKLDMYGFDARAYEFKTDNGMSCVIVFPGGSAGGSLMQCTKN